MLPPKTSSVPWTCLYQEIFESYKAEDVRFPLLRRKRLRLEKEPRIFPLDPELTLRLL